MSDAARFPSAWLKYFGPVFGRDIDGVKKMSCVNHSWMHTLLKTMMKQVFQTPGGEGFCASTIRNVWWDSMDIERPSSHFIPKAFRKKSDQQLYILLWCYKDSGWDKRVGCRFSNYHLSIFPFSNIIHLIDVNKPQNPRKNSQQRNGKG